MSSDTAYDRFAAAIDPTVAIITVTDGTDHAGCLVGFHGQVSIDPRRHGVWISRENHTFELAQRAVAVAVHLLGPADHDLAEHFGHLSGDDTDKFAAVEHHDGPLGVRLLDRLPRRIAGPCTQPVEMGGDHVLVVVDPTHVAEDPSPGAPDALRLHDVTDIEPGHPDPA